MSMYLQEEKMDKSPANRFVEAARILLALKKSVSSSKKQVTKSKLSLNRSSTVSNVHCVFKLAYFIGLGTTETAS